MKNGIVLKKLILLNLLIGIYNILPAQVQYLWDTTYGGTGGELINSVLTTNDGGFLLVGSTSSNDGDINPASDPDGSGINGGGDMWVVKLDSTGMIEWQNALGGSSGDEGYFAVQNKDSSYVICGSSNSNDGDVLVGTDPDGNIAHGNSDMWVVKLLKNGIIDWQNTIGGPGGESAFGIDKTFDKGYILIGSTDTTGGDITTGSDPDGSGWHEGYTGGGGFGSFAARTSDLWVVKLDSNGNIEWQNALGGVGQEAGFTVKQSIDSGYILSGITDTASADVDAGTDADGDGWHVGTGGAFSSSLKNNDLWVVKLNKNGILEWQNALGGSGSDGGVFLNIFGAVATHGYNPFIEDEDSNIIIACNTSSSDGNVSIANDLDGFGSRGNSDFWIIKLDKNGDWIWGNIIGGDGIDETVYSLIPNTACGGYVLSGDTYTEGISGDKTDPSPNGMSECTWSIWLDENGMIIGDKTTGSGGIPSDANDENGYIINTADGKYALVISSQNEAGFNKTGPLIGSWDFWFSIIDLNFSPAAEFSLIDEQGLCFGDSTMFEVDIEANNATYFWNFGDTSTLSDTSNLASSGYLYPQADTFEVTLIVSQFNGSGTCLDSSTQTIIIRGIPSITPIADSTICMFDTISLGASGAVSYEWTPSVGISCDDCPIPLIFALDTTTYIVKGYDTDGLCFDIDTFDINVIPLPIDFSLPNDTSICSDTGTTLQTFNLGAFSVGWSNGAISPTIKVDESGQYWATVTNAFCEISDSVNIIIDSFPNVFITGDSSLCVGDSIILEAVSSGNFNLLWSNNDTTTSIFISDTGVYWLRGEGDLGFCFSFDSLNVSFKPSPNVNLGSDTFVCKDETVLLDASVSGATYLWQDNSTDATFLVSDSGLYFVEAILESCKSSDSINITIRDCSPLLEAPKAFSPDGDGRNDLFLPIMSDIATVEVFIVYNRWGQVLHEEYNTSPDGLSGWNGYYLKKLQEIGAYLYLVKATGIEGSNLEKQGNFLLIK